MVFETRKLIRASLILGLAVCITGTGLVAFSHARRGDGPPHSGKSSLAGISSSINLTSSPRLTGVPAEVYERQAEEFNNPAGIFNNANYVPVWTQSPDGATGLPKGCTVVPPESRSWEDRFTGTFVNEKTNKVLSRADIGYIRDAVGMAVNEDPRTNFKTILNTVPVQQRFNVCADRIETVLKETLPKLNLEPSKTFYQVLRADAVHYWIKGKFVYGDEISNKHLLLHRWLTGNQLLDNPHRHLECDDAAYLGVYLIRCLEQKSPTGMKDEALTGSRYDSASDFGGHCITGVSIKCSFGNINLFYDATPFQGGIGDRFAKSTLGESKDMGPIDQVLVENLCNLMLLCYKVPDRPEELGINTTHPDGLFPLGENNKSFFLGNFVPFTDSDVRRVENENLPVEEQPISGGPFHKYRTNKDNDRSITSLKHTIDTVLRF